MAITYEYDGCHVKSTFKGKEGWMNVKLVFKQHKLKVGLGLLDHVNGLIVKNN